MNVVHFGAGNIGRGFIGKVLIEAGMKVLFLDVNKAIVEALQQAKTYRVKIAGSNHHEIDVGPFSAAETVSPEGQVAAANADIITLSIGPLFLEGVAPLLASMLEQRANQAAKERPLNIIACENAIRATSQLKAMVLQHLPASYHPWLLTHVGFVDAAVDKIVLPSSSDQLLDVTTEPFGEWIVDQTQFVGPLPTITGLTLTDNLSAFIERKLFTLNTGHAITASLGARKGYDTIQEAISDPKIAAITEGAMRESGEVLIKRHGFDAKKHGLYIQAICERFRNPYLHDEVLRVGRQPLRKLQRQERFIAPLLGALEYNLPHAFLIIGIAGVLHYDDERDAEAKQLREWIKHKGIQSTITQITAIDQKSLLAALEKAHSQLDEILSTTSNP